MNQDINTNTDSAGKISREEPLVSIIVITYNSAKYVLETLESAKRQTYQNIELIVSDDCSTDETIDICREWLNENKERFVRTNLITSEKNTGISSNCNRGVHAARGIWIKLIAGDDILTNNSLELFAKQTSIPCESKVHFIFGACQKIIGDQINEDIEMPTSQFKEMDAREQFLYLIREGNVMHGPTSFINRNALQNIGGYDERIKYSEDWPLWIKATDNGNKLFFINDVVAYYRVHDHGIYSKTLINHSYDKRLKDSVHLISELYLLPLLCREKLYFDYWHVYLNLLKEKNLSRRFKHFIYYSLQITDIKAIAHIYRKIRVKFCAI